MNRVFSFCALHTRYITVLAVLAFALIEPMAAHAGNAVLCIDNGLYCSGGTAMTATPNVTSTTPGQVVTITVTDIVDDTAASGTLCGDPTFVPNKTRQVYYGTGYPSETYYPLFNLYGSNPPKVPPVSPTGSVMLTLQGNNVGCTKFTYKGTFTVAPRATTYYTIYDTTGLSVQGVGGVATAQYGFGSYYWDIDKITVNTNTDPNTPTLTCPSALALSTDGNFSAVATDPDGDQIDYGVDFDGDGTQDIWLPFYGWVNSGTKETWTNNWDTAGTYSVGAFTRDTNLATSAWAHCNVVVQQQTGVIAGKIYGPNDTVKDMGTTVTVAGVGTYSGNSFTTGQINTGSYKVTAAALSGYSVQYCLGQSCDPITDPTAVIARSVTVSAKSGATTYVNYGYVLTPDSPAPTATCNSANTQITLSWPRVSGATFYDITADDTKTTKSPDYENDNYTPLSVTYNVTTGDSINYAVDAGNAGATSDPATGTILCGDPDLTATAGSGTQIASGHTEPMTGTVKNSGTDTTGAGFYNNFQLIKGTDTSNITSFVSHTTTLAAGTSRALSANTTAITVTATTTYRYRLCADENASMVGTITESNEGNNCSAPWVAFTVTPPPPVVVDLVCSPATVSPGDSATLSWTSSGATKCTSSDFSTGNATSGSVSTGAIATSTDKTYNISCTGSTGSDTDSCTVSSVLPDLIPVGIKNYGSVSLGDPVLITGTVKNDGATTTGRNFNNIIMTNLSSDGTSWNTIVLASTSATLTAGASRAFYGTFPASTFTAPGKYKWRYCVDNNRLWNGLVNESDEDNNCSAEGTITVVPATLTGGTCSVSPTSGYAGSAYTWTVSGVTGGTQPYTYAWTDNVSGQSMGNTSSVQYTYTDAGPKTESATVVITSADGQTQTENCASNLNGDGGSQTPVTISINKCSVSISPKKQTIDYGQSPAFSYSVSPASCASSCVFSDNPTVNLPSSGKYTPADPAPIPGSEGFDKYVVTCPATVSGQSAEGDVYVNQPTVDISADPQRVKASTDGITTNTTILWTANNVASSTGACTIYRNGQKDWAVPSVDVDGNSKGSKDDAVSTQTVYKIDCVGPHGGEATDQTIVNILPSFEEF